MVLKPKLGQHLGSIKKGKEFSFIYTNGVPLDIFLIYQDSLNGKPILWYPSFFNICDQMKNKTCRWQTRPYTPVKINLFGTEYLSIPQQTLLDIYGPEVESS